jgi:hypothetical protein
VAEQGDAAAEDAGLTADGSGVDASSGDLIQSFWLAITASTLRLKSGYVSDKVVYGKVRTT